ncbi:hypothetical protein N798_14685 [Knoellia flava TL1]|uniref:Uncharacterized protein n=2 Tax=Knoellia flava TaxID=913969 RepID=A0A8H9FRL5_9MICO|nr:hypothetical protein [Knoellia flava]KGN29328.1 hypothetical protein N798_14685 [Knoellia flava TL1]GGB67410.1 hypothetical protein GCM10011314_03270 [Knoellia flava]
MSVRAVLVGLVAGSTVLCGACTTGSTGSPQPPASPTTTPTTLRWERVPLPGGLEPVTLATSADDVVVGAITPSRPRPRLLVGPGPDDLREVPLTPRSPYAFEGRWLEVATRGGRIDAIAGARGGAHGNYRWTTWSGTAAGVAEQEQPFGVFGSYGAGDLAGIAYAGSSPVVLGAWQSEQTGMDVATWTRSGDRWARVPSTGTPLGSTPGELVDARVITARGDGLLLGGSVTRLAPGSVEVVPAVWTSPGPSGPWTRVELPRSGDRGTSEVHGAVCARDRCLLTGATDGRLSMWEVTDGTTAEPPGTPTVEVPENASVPSPVPLGDDVVVAAPTAEGTTLLRRSGARWTTATGPPGPPTSVVVHGAEVWVVTGAGRGTPALWRARVA